MSLFSIIILALVQGITEFLPISSSGHLIMVHRLFGDLESWDNRLVLDVAVHLGTLLSVLAYFRKDVWAMLSGAMNILRGDISSSGARLDLYVIAASVPVIIAGLILHLTQPSWLLLMNIVALTTLIFGVILWIADRRPAAGKRLDELTLKDALLIGLAQMLALIPGTSRSGITMTAARFLGYSRTESAHFSLLLAIIAISGAGTIAGLELYQSRNITLGLDALIAALISFIAGWVSISLMMKWLERASFTPFAIYRIILGIALLIIINAGSF